MKKNAFLTCLSAMLLLVARPSAQDPAFVTIDPTSSALTRAFGINPRGDVVGLFMTVDGVTHGFLFKSGRYTTLDAPGSIRTNALAINPRGQIAGRFDTRTGNKVVAHGYIYTNGLFETVDHPSAAGFTVLTDITPTGDIAGRYQSADGSFHGFTRVNGEWTTIDHLDAGGNPDMGPQGIQGMAMNENGLVAGIYQDKKLVFHTFILENGVYTTIDPPGSNSAGGGGGVLHVNPEGTVAGGIFTLPTDVVGSCSCSGHGFLYNAGTWTTFDFTDGTNPDGTPRHAQLTTICGINPQGEVVGIYIDHNNVTHGYLGPAGL